MNIKEQIELIAETKNELNSIILENSMFTEKKQFKVFSKELNVNLHFYSLIKHFETNIKDLEVNIEEHIKLNNKTVFYKMYFYSKNEKLIDTYYNTIENCLKILENSYQYAISPSGKNIELQGKLINISDIETKYGMKKMMLIQLKNRSFVFGFCNDNLINQIDFMIEKNIMFKASFERLEIDGFSRFKRIKLLD